ncbi:tRNA (N(6)-L-threonylcarbamoyladenosine(37)-C(2))-methylthiotransferase MtaB, partial [Candidatus Omnitrophota bacterium]
MKKAKFAVKALGCKVNQYEEQVIRENLLRLGLVESQLRDADIFILNSCTVTDTADSKTRKLIRKVKRENPEVRIFVTGCYAVFEDDITLLKAMPEVEDVIPGKDKKKLPGIIEALFTGKKSETTLSEGIFRFDAHTRAFLKVQDGCDQKCSYCKVNLVRGPSKSRDEKEVVSEAARFIAGGYRELVLTGICLGAWNGNEKRNLSDLIKEIDKLEGDFRMRLSSIEPDFVDDDLLDTIAGSQRVCRHLHLPLQSGSDKILKLMNRNYTTDQFRGLVGRIRERMPFMGLTMDVIAGFPGEDEKDIRLTMDLLKEIKPSRLHVFKYSDRKGTLSHGFPGKVPSEIAKERVGDLIAEGERLQVGFCRRFLGREVEVLVEQKSSEGAPEGYTGEYLRARLNSPGKKGKITR